MRAIRLQLRSSGLCWLFIPFTSLAIVVVLARDDYWVGIWPETGAAGQLPAFYLAMFGAGLAAWSSGTPSCRHLDEQYAAAATSRWSISLHRSARY